MPGLHGGDGLDIDPADPAYDMLIEQWVGGTYNVGWPRLKMAFCGSMISAIEKSVAVARTADKAIARGAARAETGFLVEFNYDVFVLGPCLSALLLASFSTESFLRLGMLVALEEKRTDAQRRAGADESIDIAMSAFDSTYASARIDLLSDRLGMRKLPQRDKARRAVEELVSYRNDCVHDSPILTLRPREYEKIATSRRGSKRVSSSLGPYERLSLSRRPIRLSHAVLAAEAHDGIVEHFYRACKNEFWLSNMRALDVSLGDGTLASCLPTTVSWGQVRQIAQQWDDGPHRSAAEVPGDELRQMGLDLRRRSRLKIETPDR